MLSHFRRGRFRLRRGGRNVGVRLDGFGENVPAFVCLDQRFINDRFGRIRNGFAAVFESCSILAPALVTMAKVAGILALALLVRAMFALAILDRLAFVTGLVFVQDILTLVATAIGLEFISLTID